MLEESFFGKQQDYKRTQVESHCTDEETYTTFKKRMRWLRFPAQNNRDERRIERHHRRGKDAQEGLEIRIDIGKKRHQGFVAFLGKRRVVRFL